MKRTVLALALIVAGAGLAHADPYFHGRRDVRAVPHAPAAHTVVVPHRPAFVHHHRPWWRRWL